LPKGTARTAGLLTIDLSTGVRRGDIYNITVRQITEAALLPSYPRKPRVQLLL
jgi:hypothetical protein